MNQFYQPVPVWGNIQPQIPQITQQVPQQVQSTFLVVKSEDEVDRYPIAPGNIITFKIEGQPIVIEKALGFSQFDTPKKKRFRLTEEDAPEPVKEDPVVMVTKEDFDHLVERIDGIESEIAKVKSSLPKRPVAKKKEDDDE